MKWVVDTGLLFAAVNVRHEKNAAARRWLDKAKEEGWGVPVEAFLGTIRLLMNEKVMLGSPLDASEAVEVVRVELAGRHKGGILHGEPDDKFLLRAQGHRQIMDFHLVGIAAAHKARLATLDRGLAREWPQFTGLVG